MFKLLSFYFLAVFNTEFFLHAECARGFSSQRNDNNSSPEIDATYVTDKRHTKFFDSSMIGKNISKSKTLIVVVLDISRSEEADKLDIINGYNAFLQKQLKMTNGGVNTRLLLVKFNKYTKVKVTLLADAPRLTAQNYQPYGGTALFDAVVIGVGIAKAVKRDDERVIFIIITDGQDNSSKKVGYPEVTKLMAEKTSSGQWSFQCFGTTPEEMERLQDLESEKSASELESQTLCKINLASFTEKPLEATTQKTNGRMIPNKQSVEVPLKKFDSSYTPPHSNQAHSNTATAEKVHFLNPSEASSKLKAEIHKNYNSTKTMFILTTRIPKMLPKNEHTTTKTTLDDNLLKTTLPLNKVEKKAIDDATKKIQPSKTYPIHSSMSGISTKNGVKARPHINNSDTTHNPWKTVFITTTMNPKKHPKNKRISAKRVSNKNLFKTMPSNAKRNTEAFKKLQYSKDYPNTYIHRITTQSWIKTKKAEQEHDPSIIPLKQNMKHGNGSSEKVTREISPSKNNNTNVQHEPVGKVSQSSTISSVDLEGAQKHHKTNKKKNLFSGGQLKLKNRDPLLYQQFLDRLRAKEHNELMHTCNVGACS